MTTTVEAIYEDGILLLPRPLSRPEKSHVRLTVESEPEQEDAATGLLDKTRRNQVLRELDDSEGW